MNRPVNDPYFNPKRTRDILFGVLLVHIGIIAVPLIYSSLTDYLEPPLVVMKVGLADLPLGDSPDAGQPVQADTPAKTDPAPLDDFPEPADIKPLPPEQKIDVPPPPKNVQTKVEPKVDPPKPKTDAKAKTDPPPKPKTDTKAKTDPPKSTILSPKEIKVTTNTKSQAQIDAEKKAALEAEEARRKAERARQELIAGIQKDASQPGRFGTTDPGQEGILATKELRDYYNRLIAFIQPKWDALSPANTELNGKISNWPVVQLTIAKDGSITHAEFVKQSGNKKIDDPVNVLLASLKAVPVPPQPIKINVTLDIR